VKEGRGDTFPLELKVEPLVELSLAPFPFFFSSTGLQIEGSSLQISQIRGQREQSDLLNSSLP